MWSHYIKHIGIVHGYIVAFEYRTIFVFGFTFAFVSKKLENVIQDLSYLRSTLKKIKILKIKNY